jgi:FixJ family two-component response regulator
MPDFSGLDLLKTLKEHDHNLPFFFLTGSADFSATEALKAGALHLFRKPCSAGEIAVHIRQSLNGCPHEPEIVSSVQIS